MQRIFKSFAAVAVTAAVFAPAAHANLIQNGSFENYNLGNACKNSASIGCVNVGAGATLASGQWAILGSPSGNTGTLADWNTGTLGVELRNNVAGSAFDGNIFVELDTTANSLVYQNIGTTLGTHYLLSFAYQPRPGVTNASNPIRVTWNGSTVNAFSSIISGNGCGVAPNNLPGCTNTWVTSYFDVVGNTPISTLTFTALTFPGGGALGGDSVGGSLDNVELVAVPEPATLTLLGLGLAGLGWARRRKHVA